jgi:hypothetical protein
MLHPWLVMPYKDLQLGPGLLQQEAPLIAAQMHFSHIGD